MWQLWRQDDQSNLFLVATYASAEEAESERLGYEAKTPRQTWWIRPPLWAMSPQALVTALGSLESQDPLASELRRLLPVTREDLPAEVEPADYGRFRQSDPFLALLAEARHRRGQLCLEHRDFTERLNGLAMDEVGPAVQQLVQLSRANPWTGLELLRAAMEYPDKAWTVRLCEAACQVTSLKARREFLQLYPPDTRLQRVEELVGAREPAPRQPARSQPRPASSPVVEPRVYPLFERSPGGSLWLGERADGVHMWLSRIVVAREAAQRTGHAKHSTSGRHIQKARLSTDHHFLLLHCRDGSTDVLSLASMELLHRSEPGSHWADASYDHVHGHLVGAATPMAWLATGDLLVLHPGGEVEFAGQEAGRALGLRVSPDGHHWAAVCSDHVKVGGRSLPRPDGHGQVAFSLDSRYLLIGGSNGARAWPLDEGAESLVCLEPLSTRLPEPPSRDLSQASIAEMASYDRFWEGR